MRIRELRAHLEGLDESLEVFVGVSLDFLSRCPKIVSGYDIVWDGDRLLLNVSVRLGDLALQWAEDEPCDGCPLDAVSDWFFEHSDIHCLVDELCDRPDNQYRCCFLPEPLTGDDTQGGISAYSGKEDDLPF